MKKNILVTGHTGMLGRNIVNVLLPFQKFKLFGVSKNQKLNLEGVEEFNTELADDDNVKCILDKVKPEIIFHTAAFTNLDYCENNRIQTYQLHVKLTETLARFEGSKLIYISTDSVFDGKHGNYGENDPTYPLNYYAHSKLEGEWAALAFNPKTLVIRTNLYGFKTPFGNSLAEWALKSFKEGKTIKGFNDVVFNPLYARQLADLVLRLIDTYLEGRLHVGCLENMSKFRFLKELASAFGYPEMLVTESASPVDNALRKPRDTTLDINYLKKVLNVLPSISTGLQMLKADYLKLV